MHPMRLAMKSEHYRYKVAAVYPDAMTAEAAVQALKTNDLGETRIFRLDPGAGDVDLAIEPEPTAARDEVVKGTVTGGASGVAAAAVTAGAAALATPALFVSAPVVGPLVVLGYGAMIGGAAGAILGLSLPENMFADIVKDTLKAGYHVIIVHAAGKETRHRVHDVIGSTMTVKTGRA
jgi:hypothetical protein